MILLRLVLGFMGIGIAAYAVHGGFKYTRMIGTIFSSLVYNPELTAGHSSIGEKITILDSSDHEIEALLVEKKDAKKMLIFCHESGSGKESWEKYAYFIPSLGFNVLSLDFRNVLKDSAPNNLSQWPSDTDVQRLLMAVRWAKRAFTPEKIVLFGVSNGADIAFAASFENPSVSGVITDGLFSMKEIFRDYIRKWAPILVKPNIWGKKLPEWVVQLFTQLGFLHCQKIAGKKFVEVEALLKRKHVPLLMIHGEGDDYVPATHQLYLEKITFKKDPFSHWVAPNAGHNEAVIVHRKLYEENIKAFLEKI